MKRTYNTGLDVNKISFSATVGTVGIAYTSVLCKRTGGQQTKLAESTSKSGNIANTMIGEAITLKSSYLIITTYIDFSAFDKKQWEELKETIVIRYHLDGGFSGAQQYNHDLDDVQAIMEGKIVIVSKPIEMV